MENNEIDMQQDVVTPEPAQLFEGDDLSALMTAKERMAQRDAEYSAKFAEAAEKSFPTPKPKPAAKKSAPAAKRTSRPTPEYAEDAPMQEKPAGKAEEPAAESAAEPVAKAAEEKPMGVKLDDMKGGLRSLRGANQVPEKADRAEYITAWKKLK